MPTNEKFLEALQYMNTTMKADNKAGNQWKYCNVTSKKAKNFAQARKQHKYLINCVDGVQWACKMAGIPSSALAWYGQKGGTIAWCNKDAKANAKKYFQLIKCENKTVTWLLNHGQLCEGDILTYVNMNHTNAYIGNHKSFDSGHAYASGSGENAPFSKWIGALAHKASKVGYIIRIKDRKHYRVQAGAYYKQEEADKQIAKLKKLKYDVVIKREDDMIKLQVGYFISKENAQALVTELASKKIGAFIKEE